MPWLSASHVSLGVHYPADVLAGWCLAIAWTLLFWLAWPRLARRLSRLAPVTVPRRPPRAAADDTDAD
jgi:membrane-associated phospholipid phosphatase